MPGTSAGFRLSSTSKGIRIHTQSHRPIQKLARFSQAILRPFLAYSLIPSDEAILKVGPPSSLDYSTRHGCQTTMIIMVKIFGYLLYLRCCTFALIKTMIIMVKTFSFPMSHGPHNEFQLTSAELGTNKGKKIWKNVLVSQNQRCSCTRSTS